MVWFIGKAVPERQYRVAEKLVAAAAVTVDDPLHQREVSICHSNDIGGAQIRSVGERGKPSQIHQQNRNVPLVAVEWIGEAATSQRHEPCWGQIAASGSVQASEQSSMADRSKANDGGKCRNCNEYGITHRKPNVGEYERDDADQAAEKNWAHQSECDRSGQLHEQNRGWRDVALAECQRAFVPKSHEGKKQGETSPRYEAQPLWRQRYGPLACRRLDRRYLHERPWRVVDIRPFEKSDVRRAPVRGRSETSATQETGRPPVLVFAEHSRAHNHDSALDVSSNVFPPFRR